MGRGKWRYAGYGEWEYKIPRVGIGLVEEREYTPPWRWEVGIYTTKEPTSLNPDGLATYNTLVGYETNKETAMSRVEEILDFVDEY